MVKKVYLLLPLIALIAFVQCETPGSPDFTLSNKIEAPLIAESTFQFLGDRNALIDTTNADIRDLLDSDSDNFITISQEATFDFGDLEGAMPEVDVASTSFESMVGEIELGSFSSQDEEGNVGEASFNDLTGQPAALSEGDPLPGAESPFPVNIELDTDFFVSARIKQGGLEITLRNELGFDIEELTLDIMSGTNSVGQIIIAEFNHITTRSESITIVENPETDPEVELTDISVDVSIRWENQTMQDDAGSMIVKHIYGQNLIASAVEAEIQPQEFRSSGSSDFSDDEFLFNTPSHYVELRSGTLFVQNIINSIDVDIDILEITFPGLRSPPYSEADSLVIRVDGDQNIPRNNTEPVSRSFDLSDVRIYAENNVVSYNIFARTEDTQASPESDSRTITETDRVSAEVELSDLLIEEVFGVIANRQVLLNTDVASDGSSVDIMNDIEAEIIEIDGIKDISSRIEGLEFTRASLSILYETNVGVDATIIGAFLGEDANGNQFFLKGEPGTDAEVTGADPIQQLQMDGMQIAASDLIQFNIKENSSAEETLTTTFDRTNSAIIDFLNRLPTSIRFIGLANINPDNAEGTIQNPVVFDPTITVNIPLALRADRASYIDTTALNLEDFPGPDDDSILDEGSLTIRYINSIPLGINLELEFLTIDNELITAVPFINDTSIEFKAAAVGNSGFSVSPSEDITIIHLSRSQLEQINQTRNVRLISRLNTTANEEIRIRTTDDVSVSVSGKFVIRNKID